MDKEKVITHLDDMRLFADTRVHKIVSPENWEVYSDLCDFIDLVKEELLTLLKEDAVIPIQDSDYIWICGNCGEEIYNDGELHDNYCSNCGTKVKWTL